MPFSKNFIWGAASAAHQVEGAYNEDGKGLGIWDALSEGKIRHNDTGNVACDHYHRYKEDVALMKQMGLKSYRFSVSWPRVMPEEGKVNQKGIEFYKNLVDELVKNDIKPMCTIFHWNLPMWLHEKGGWTWDGISDEFEKYAKIVAEALSDKVSCWMTINEPLCFGGSGYIYGNHAPFESVPEDSPEFFPKMRKLSRNILLAHGKAVKAVRENAKTPPTIGIALNGNVFTPFEETSDEIETARRKTFCGDDLQSLNWWLDPMMNKTAPKNLAEALSEADLEIISQKLDFIGINVYNSQNFGVDRDTSAVYAGLPRTAMGWPITPEVLYWTVRFVNERYDMPVLITENGMANIDFIMSDGAVHDIQRIEYLKGYLKGLKRAADENFPVIGYLYWSLTDNFEWTVGYDARFGLIYTDYRTLKRTPKDSAKWYSEVITKNGENL